MSEIWNEGDVVGYPDTESESIVGILLIAWDPETGEFGNEFRCEYTGADWQEEIEDSVSTGYATGARVVDVFVGQMLAEHGSFALYVIDEDI